jgi:uncharacterized protein (TIGR04141 family)
MTIEVGQISLFLAKEKKAFDEIQKGDTDLKSRKAFAVSNFASDGAKCRFIYFESPSQKANPPWLDFVNSRIPKPSRIEFAAKGLSANGILMIDHENRIFVAAFGRSAGGYINRRALEPDFGIRTALAYVSAEVSSSPKRRH